MVTPPEFEEALIDVNEETTLAVKVARADVSV
jgi:hypothetical protein